jgi:hypothetical protein
LVIESLANHPSVENLSIGPRVPDDVFKALTNTLKSNKALKSLTFVVDAEKESLEKFSDVTEVMRNNSTIEKLYLIDVSCKSPLLEAKHINPLLGNTSLKSLGQYVVGTSTTETFAVSLELLQRHPTLHSIDLGYLPEDKQFVGNLIRTLKPNPRIHHVETNWGNYEEDKLTDNSDHASFAQEFLTVLGNFPNLSSIEMVGLPLTDYLIDFLKTHPQISTINLRSEDLTTKESRKKVLTLVKGQSHIKYFFFSTETLRKQTSFLKELNHALWINQQIDLNLKTASEAMKKILDQKSMTDESLPFVPLDVTNELTKAIARHVPPEKAKAIFDELIIHAPGHQKTM